MDCKLLELVESARLQVFPDIDAGEHSGRERRDVVSWVLNTAARRVGPLHPISVSGRSRTADYLRKHGVAVAEPIPVEVFVEAVGGPEAWWWASWTYHDSYFWCVAGEGSRDVGEVDISGDTDAGRVVEVARFASLSNNESTDAEIRSGPYCSDHPREEQMSAALGAVLVPAPLRRRLIRGRGRPLSLVVTGNLTALLPFPLLGIDVDPGNGQVTRLVETAVIRAAPPAVLINRVADHPLHMVDSYPVLIACVDPTGDLQYSGGVPAGAVVVLSGRLADGKQTPTDALPATAGNLVQALRSLPPSTPGVFYYSGHATSGATGDDLWSGLVVAGGQKLSPNIIFREADAVPAVPFPTRVLLAACSSAGSSGSGSGEWFGITAAVLWAGARQVVVTSWPVWDTPFTAALDLRVVDALRDTGDPAAALRTIQLEHLATWRGASPSSSAAAQPLIWAAYSCYGTAW